MTTLPKSKTIDFPQQETALSEKTWKPDDDMIALELAETLKAKAAYFHNAWKVYDSGVWAERDSYEFRRFIRAELRNWRSRGVTVTQARIKALASMLEDDLFVSDRKIMQSHPERQRYVNLKNGLFNLETMELEPHRADLYFTNQLDFDYDPEAIAPTFKQYLLTSLVLPGTGNPDISLMTLACEGLAYSMTARTDLKASFWLVGQKDSGKSTFIALIKAIMGALHTTIDLNQLGVNRFLLSGIVGKRVLTFTEASSSTMLPDALYKALVGGSDEIYADVKNRDPIAFRPEAKVWWAMNEMPRINDRSGATTRRIIIIPFNRSIPVQDRVQDLEQRLFAERSGIFNEMIKHYQRLVERGGFTRSQQSEDLRDQYILENDTEATFIEERADIHESHSIHSAALYTEYLDWCEARGFKPKNFNQIAQDWRRLGFEVRKSNGLKVWHGLRLKLKR